MFKKFATSLLAMTLIAGCVSNSENGLLAGNEDAEKKLEQSALPKNVIMVVADGMGPAYVTAYRNYMDNPETEVLEEIVLDDILLGTSRTYPHSVSGYITDSAASATALATGVKTYNGAIGMTVDKQALETVLHRARKYGMKTGLAVTSTIVHATPASYMVANEQRRNYAQIADSFFDDRIEGKFLADLMLGAGREHFIREDRNVAAEFESEGYQYIDKYEDLPSIDKNKPVLGLFADNALPWALDDSDPLRLTSLTKAALEHLDNNKGFFLLVEASQVDWAGHANDISSAMAEMNDFANTIDVLKAFHKVNEDTLVVITADHSTGGLTVAASDGYRWDPKWLKNINASVGKMAREIVASDDKVGYLTQALGFDLSQEQQNLLSIVSENMSQRDVENIIKGIVDEKTNTGWTTNGHTGVDVNVYGFGPGAERFTGNLNNTDIALRIFDILDEAHSK